ncbi:MAG: globin domain-containing protein [Planctomycetaceae bacterium]
MHISESVQALLASKQRVIERFYERFLTEYPELRRHFENRDMRIQASMLTVALASVEAYYSQRFFATGHYLKVLGHRHYHEGVRPEDYSKFSKTLLETLQGFLGDDWSPELEHEWRQALDLAIETMLEGYKGTYTW